MSPLLGQDNKFIKIIEKEISRLGLIIKQMYGLFDQNSSGPAIVDIIEVIEDVLVIHAAMAKRNNVVIAPLTHSVAQKVIPLHLSEVQQVLHNLVKNAIEAMTENGGVLAVHLSQTDEILTLSFKDTGPGIAPGNLDRIFAPFFTTKIQHDGTGLGLGLSVSRDIINDLGGNLTVESIEGKGSIFTITLPLADH